MLPPLPPFKIQADSSSTRTYYPRRCKKFRRNTNINQFPDELLSEILGHLLARDIYRGPRLVCRKWYHITHTKHFIHKQLHQTGYGLLYKNGSGLVTFISAREDGAGGIIIDSHNLNYNYRIMNPVWSSTCNGLMLQFETYRSHPIYYIRNVSTNRVSRLPLCPHEVHTPACIGVGYDVTSMTHKVVVSYNISSRGQRHVCGILTLGVDRSWRAVGTDHLSDLGKWTVTCCPVVTEGFLHWKKDGGVGIVTMDLETERVSESVVPKVEENNLGMCFLSAERCLSLLIQCGKYAWEVFEMKSENGDWKNVARVCLEGQTGKIKRFGYEEGDEITPCGWLKYPNVLTLRIGCEYIFFYNLMTCEVVKAGKRSIQDSMFALHKNSTWVDPKVHFLTPH